MMFSRIKHAFLTLAIASLAVTGAAQAESKKEAKWQVNHPKGVFKPVDIDVTSGTWMNIDVSPDGKTIAFDLLGDIYTLPISGGEAKPLMTDIAWQMQPRFSPDGKTIAFTSDEDGGDNLWLMNRDGSNRHAITKETFRLINSPAWSPDGNFLIARKHFTGSRSLGAGEVWLYHKQGGSGVMLTKRPNQQKDLGEPAYSPDGKYVYFSQDATPGKTFHYSKDSESGIYKIKRLELATGEIKVLISGRGGAIRPTPSPDGKTLAYISRVDFQSTLFLYDLASGEKRAIYSKLDRDMQETWAIHGVYPTMAWHPNGRELLFWAGGKIHRLNTQTGEDKIIPFHVSVQKRIQKALHTEQQIAQDKFEVKMLRNVNVSPNGKQVVFEAMGHIYTRSLPSGKPKRLTRNKNAFEFYPSYSRDGKKVVYVTWDDQQQGQIYTVSSRGGKGKPLLKEKGKYVEPSFSPDGKTIVFRKVSGGFITDPKWGLNTGIYQVSSRGGKAKLITEQGVAPHFGKQNDRIYITLDGEKPTLARVDLDGQHFTKLYDGKFATEFHVSPNGEYLAFAERFKVFVTPYVERGQLINLDIKGGNLPVKQLSLRAGENISWNRNASEIYWSLGHQLFQADVTGLFEIDTDKTAKVQVKETNLSFNQKADKPSGMLAFVGGKIVTMEGNKVIENGTVLVENNRIIAVGKADEIKVPSKAKVVNIQGKSLIPGLIDAHAHGPQGSSQLIPKQNWKNYAGLALGVTTIHDPSNDTREFFAASEMQKAGRIVAARLFSTGTILYGATVAGYTSHVDSLDDAKFHVYRQQQAGAFSVKSYNQPRRNQRQQIIEAARELNMLVVPEGGSLLEHNLTMIIDGHTTLEHSLPVANIYDDIKQLWSQSKMAYTPTLVVGYGGIWGENYWYDTTDVWKHPRLSKFVPSDILAPRSMRRPKAPLSHYNHFNNAKVAKQLADAGVTVNAGGHGQREGLAMHWEIWMMAQGGMTPIQALQTATINPAKTFGLDKQLGSIKSGKLADLVVIDGDITQDIRLSDKVVYTMVNGRLYDAATMNEIGHYQHNRKPFFFEKQ